MTSDRPEPDILLEEAEGLGRITLNRPKALNTLSLGMYRALAPRLEAWAVDPAIHALLLRGAGERAFCAGGDVRALWEIGPGSVPQRGNLKSDFFYEEYRLIRRLHRYPKPSIAYIDGITMGGGAGVSINGSHCIATERTLFAMPETAIGLFPDVGATRYLDRCPGRIGLYLALTGARLGAADLVYCGLATHYVPRDRLPALTAALAATVWIAGREHAQADAAIARFGDDPGPAPLAALRPAIDRCFGLPSVEAIVAAVERQEGDWARQAAQALGRASPTSLKLTFRQMELGRGFDIEAALALEYRMTQHVMVEHDFFEGIRAVLVDKDQAPRWQPASLAAVSDAAVDRYFADLGERELRFD